MMRHTLSTLSRYLRTPAARSAEEFGDAIEEEIAFHISQRTREFVAQGMSLDEARRQACERFGDPAQVAAQCHAEALGGLAIWHRLHLAMTAGLAVAVVALWITLPAGMGGFGPNVPPGIASMLDNDWTGAVQGQILDERGDPIEGANLLIVVKAWPDPSYFQRAYTARSDGDGRFLIENVHPVNERYEVQIAALAEHRVLKSSYHQRSLGALAPVVFELPPSSGLALQVETARGKTLPGVEVLPHARMEAGGDEHLVYFDSAQPVVRRTALDGQVVLPYFQPGDTATILLRTSRGDWQSREVIVPAEGKIATVRISTANESPLEES